MHASMHMPNGIPLLVGANPANPTGSIGRAHADDIAAPNPCPSGYSPGGTAFSPNGGPETVQCYPDLGSGGGGGGTGNCSSNVECGQPCYEGGSGCAPQLAQGSSCETALGKNSTINGSNNHNDMISNAFTLWTSLYGTNVAIAYEYQTYGGQEYIQFFVSGGASAGASVFNLSVSSTADPIIPFNGNVYTALNLAADAVNLTMPSLPPPLNSITPNMHFTQSQCNAKLWPQG